MNDQSDHPETSSADSAAEEIAATVEAILFAADSPLPASRIASVAELPVRSVRQSVERLNDKYDRNGATFRIEEVAGGYQMMTQPQYHDVLTRLVSSKKDSRLSQAAMETLAIVAYRQPILRADIEAIRGVACGEVLRGLMERQLVKIVGRAEVIGRPMLYGTTKKFLEVFGLPSLDDLPRIEELRTLTEEATSAVMAVGETTDDSTDANGPDEDEDSQDPSDFNEPDDDDDAFDDEDEDEFDDEDDFDDDEFEDDDDED